jgi:hypothetical protein
MEGKDVVLEEVDAEEATSLADLDEGGEMRPRMTRPRGAADELALPVPHDDESALSGKMNALEFPLPLPDKEERPGRRRASGGGFKLLFVGALILAGAAFGGQYFGLLREKMSGLTSALAPATSASQPAPDKADKAAAVVPAEKPAAATPDAGAAAAVAPTPPSGHVTAHKAEEPAPAREPARRHGAAEKREHKSRIDELKGMMAPDPSLDPAPAPSAPPSPPPAPSP